MGGKPFFSVIIPTYNRRDFLLIALQSVVEQTFSDYELIIVDDGSDDDSVVRIKPVINRLKQVKYIYQTNQGVSAARNRGIRSSNGKFIAFLDSDDRFCRNKLEVVYRHIKNNPGYKIFHTDEVWYRNGRLLPQKKYHRKPSGFIFKEALKLCCVSFSAATIKKDLFEDVGLLDKNFPAAEDYEFWLRATSRYPVYLITRALTIKEGGHPGQLSKKYPAMDRFRIQALEKTLRNDLLSEENYRLVYRELKRKCDIYIKGTLKRGREAEAKTYLALCQKLNNKMKHA